ncbi:FAD-dependent oxidoreductase [Methylopila sp. 73B]|uniref:FAD-dependent oxidoreductase n=1 Tax=Methylopila sp. 73B TaxID=1120792 RepID=UPI00038088D6|nr:FAD-dependent oxidoreductase [Methylopila sp. 73B]
MRDITRRAAVAGLASGLTLPFAFRSLGAEAPRYGVLVYGGTASGVMAAFAAAREGVRTALVLGPNPLGGMPANGLGWSDAPNQKWIGGLTMEFFRRVGRAYGKPHPVTEFEPHVAYAVFKQMVRESGVDMYTNSLAMEVAVEGGKLLGIKLNTGLSLSADAFVDASYEGDLMAMAKVSYVVGREAGIAFNESGAGYDRLPTIRSYKTRDTAGRLLPGINPYTGQTVGSGDKRVQAYTFRLCLSNDPKNRAAWRAPPGYDPDRYVVEANRLGANSTFVAGHLAADKFDRNGNFPGGSWAYPDGDRTTRNKIWREHYNYQAGLMYFYATDRRVPSQFREQANAYGLALDEFTNAGNWPTQLYIRAGRRLRGSYIFSQKDCQTAVTKPDSVGIGSYPLDTHVTQYQETADGKLNFEGCISHPTAEVSPYQIPYRILTPHAVQAANLLVSVCVSASHVGIATLRMEPQYMMMGEAAGLGAALAAKNKIRVQSVPGSELQGKLRAYGAVLSI